MASAVSFHPSPFEPDLSIRSGPWGDEGNAIDVKSRANVGKKGSEVPRRLFGDAGYLTIHDGDDAIG